MRLLQLRGAGGRMMRAVRKHDLVMQGHQLLHVLHPFSSWLPSVPFEFLGDVVARYEPFQLRTRQELHGFFVWFSFESREFLGV